MGLPSRTFLSRWPWLGPLLLVSLMFGALAMVWYSGLAGVTSREQLEEIVNGYGFWAPLAYILLYGLVAFIFPISFLTLAGGLLFGFGAGLAYSVAGATLAGCASFVASRYLGLKSIETWLSGKLGLGQLLNKRMRSFAGFTWLQKKMDSIESSNSLQTEVRATATLYMVRLIFPFFAVSFLAGLSRISSRAYLIGTFAGALTANFLLLSLSENLLTITGIQDLLAWGIVWPLLLFIMLLALPFVFLRYRESEARTEEREAV